MAVRLVGAGSTSPCTWVKHLDDILGNKVNSQQYPSIYEDKRPKSIEDTENTDVEAPVTSPSSVWRSHRGMAGISPLPKHGEGATQRDLRPQAPRRVRIMEGPASTPID